MSVRRSLGWTSIAQVVLFLVQFFAQIVLARLLSPTEIGIAALGFSISGLIGILQTFGLKNLLIREPVLSDQFSDTVFTVDVIICVTITALLVLTSLAGERFGLDRRVARVLLVLSIVPLFDIIEIRPSAMLQRQFSFRSLALIGMSKAAVTTFVTVSAALAGASYMSIVYGALSAALVSSFGTAILGRKHVRLAFSLREHRRVTKFGLHMLATGGASNAAARLNDIMVSQILGLRALGLFSRASTLNNVLWENIHSVFTKVVFSAFAEEWRTEGSLEGIYLRTLNFITAILWPAFLGLAILAGPAVNILYGPKWLDAAPVLCAFAIAAMFLTSITMTWEVFIVCGATGEQVKIEGLRALFTVAFTFVGAQFGYVQAACARVGDSIISILLYRAPVSRLVRAPRGAIANIYAANAVLTGLAVLPSLALMGIQKWRADTSPAEIAGAVLLGIALWGGGIALSRHALAHESMLIFEALKRSRSLKRRSSETSDIEVAATPPLKPKFEGQR